MLTTFKDWLTKLRNPELTNKTSVAQVEASTRLWVPPPVWGQLKSQMRPGDELWEFCSSAESWRMYMGRAGIALVRKGKIIASLVTKLN